MRSSIGSSISPSRLSTSRKRALKHNENFQTLDDFTFTSFKEVDIYDTTCIIKLIDANQLLASDLVTGKSDPRCFIWIGPSFEEPDFSIKIKLKHERTKDDYIFVYGKETNPQDPFSASWKTIQPEKVPFHKCIFLSSIRSGTVDPIWYEEIKISLHNINENELKDLRCVILIRDEDFDENSVRCYDDLGMIEFPLIDIVNKGKLLRNGFLVNAKKFKLQKVPRMRRVDGFLRLNFSLLFPKDQAEDMINKLRSTRSSNLSDTSSIHSLNFDPSEYEFDETLYEEEIIEPMSTIQEERLVQGITESSTLIGEDLVVKETEVLGENDEEELLIIPSSQEPQISNVAKTKQSPPIITRNQKTNATNSIKSAAKDSKILSTGGNAIAAVKSLKHKEKLKGDMQKQLDELTKSTSTGFQKLNTKLKNIHTDLSKSLNLETPNSNEASNKKLLSDHIKESKTKFNSTAGPKLQNDAIFYKNSDGDIVSAAVGDLESEEFPDISINKKIFNDSDVKTQATQLIESQVIPYSPVKTSNENSMAQTSIPLELQSKVLPFENTNLRHSEPISQSQNAEKSHKRIDSQIRHRYSNSINDENEHENNIDMNDSRDVDNIKEKYNSPTKKPESLINGDKYLNPKFDETIDIVKPTAPIENLTSIPKEPLEQQSEIDDVEVTKPEVNLPSTVGRKKTFIDWGKIDQFSINGDFSSCFNEVLNHGDLDDLSQIMQYMGPKPHLLQVSILNKTYQNIAIMLAQEKNIERCLIWILSLVKGKRKLILSMNRSTIRELVESLGIIAKIESKQGILAGLLVNKLNKHL